MGAGVMTQVSRRGLMGIAGAAAVLPVEAHAQAMPGLSGLPRFGPAPDIAHLLYNENPYGPPPSAIPLGSVPRCSAAAAPASPAGGTAFCLQLDSAESEPPQAVHTQWQWHARGSLSAALVSWQGGRRQPE